MKQQLTRLEARMQRVTAASCAAFAWLADSWTFAPVPVTVAAATNTKPGYVAICTATDVHARRPQESSP